MNLAARIRHLAKARDLIAAEIDRLEHTLSAAQEEPCPEKKKRGPRPGRPPREGSYTAQIIALRRANPAMQQLAIARQVACSRELVRQVDKKHCGIIGNVLRRLRTQENHEERQRSRQRSFEATLSAPAKLALEEARSLGFTVDCLGASALRINGHLVKTHQASRPITTSPGCKRQYLHVACTAMADFHAVVDPRQGDVWILPQGSIAGSHVYLPTADYPIYNGILPRVDRRQYLNAWHLLAPAAVPCAEESRPSPESDRAGTT